jgi:hypothetical protein
MPAKPEPPAWLVPGATVYSVRALGHGSDHRAIPLTVERLTNTQVVLRTSADAETRFRLSDLRQVGRDPYSSPELIEPADPRVLAQRNREVAKRAMAELRRAHEEVAGGALIYRNDPETALSIALRFQAAATTAVAKLSEITNRDKPKDKQAPLEIREAYVAGRQAQLLDLPWEHTI